jgi:Uma2 family endonuclease
MSEPYEELLEGERWLRLPPDDWHERICARLHERVRASLDGNGTSRLLAVRAPVPLGPTTAVRPDLALVTAATGRLWLAAEIVNAGDHRPDTVVKKDAYERAGLARLWMIDPRYDNVEVYQGGPYGLALKGILAGPGILAEALLPAFRITAAELFAPHVQV